MACELDVILPSVTAVPFLVIIDASSKQNVSQSRAAPPAVHNCAVQPIDALYLLDSCAHRMTPVAGALKCACDRMLGKFVRQSCNREV
jgi:hypothetical protein